MSELDDVVNELRESAYHSVPHPVAEPVAGPRRRKRRRGGRDPERTPGPPTASASVTSTPAGPSAPKLSAGGLAPVPASAVGATRKTPIRPPAKPRAWPKRRAAARPAAQYHAVHTPAVHTPAASLPSVPAATSLVKKKKKPYTASSTVSKTRVSAGAAKISAVRAPSVKPKWR